MKAKILKAIRGGNHKTREIIANIGAELKYREFCKAMAELLSEGKVILTEVGYNLSK